MNYSEDAEDIFQTIEEETTPEIKEIIDTDDEDYLGNLLEDDLDDDPEIEELNFDR